MFSVKDKIFLVTGGAAGIGAGIVRALIYEEARYVVFLDVAEREGASLESELSNKYGALRAKFIKCDVANEADLAAAYKQVFDKYRRLDVVINNAAVLSSDERYKRMVDINFTATINSTMKALELMSVEQGGNGGAIVNLSSMLALKHTTHLPVYSATKLAVLHFTNSFGTEECYSKTKVRILTVCLGPTDTAILERHNLENFRKDSVQSLTSRVPVRQRVESAVKGILDVCKQGNAGSTWLVDKDKQAENITGTIRDGFNFLSRVDAQ